MILWSDAAWWAAGLDAWGEIVTYDPCDSPDEAQSFVRDELNGRGAVMTAQELIDALALRDDGY